MRDHQFSCPTTFQCFCPHHFLRTKHVLPYVSSFMLPKRRVMDNMEVGWDRPQEDEFALCNLGIPSPYLYWAFPAQRAEYDRYLTLETLTPAERQQWKAALLWFLKRLTLNDARRLALKSPAHTARLDTLLEMFPDAKFVHLSRDPRTVIPSTIRTWERMRMSCGLEFSGKEDTEELVFDTFRRMYQSYGRHCDKTARNQLVELRYEDLVAEPLGTLRMMYDQLELPGFAQSQGRFKRHLRHVAGYRTNRFELPPDHERQIADTCGAYMDRFGYSQSSSSSSSQASSSSTSSSSTSSHSS
jgi:hypothetical protein